MDEAKLREVLTTALPAERIKARAHALGVVKRESVIELDGLVSALVLVSRTPAGGRQADVMRSYNKTVTEEPVRGAFYARFNTGLESLLESLLVAQQDLWETGPPSDDAPAPPDVDGFDQGPHLDPYA